MERRGKFMNVKLNPLARQMSTLHTAHFAKPEEKKETYSDC